MATRTQWDGETDSRLDYIEEDDGTWAVELARNDARTDRAVWRIFGMTHRGAARRACHRHQLDGTTELP